VPPLHESLRQHLALMPGQAPLMVLPPADLQAAVEMQTPRVGGISQPMRQSIYGRPLGKDEPGSPLAPAHGSLRVDASTAETARRAPSRRCINCIIDVSVDSGRFACFPGGANLRKGARIIYIHSGTSFICLETCQNMLFSLICSPQAQVTTSSISVKLGYPNRTGGCMSPAPVIEAARCAAVWDLEPTAGIFSGFPLSAS
jgi:hypothetical protein